MAWRSKEQAHNMKKKFNNYENEDHEDSSSPKSTPNTGKKKRKKYADGIGPERMPDEFFDSEGDFNLSKVKGEKARLYFQNVLRLPLPPGITRQVPMDETSQEIRKAYGLSGEQDPRTRR